MHFSSLELVDIVNRELKYNVELLGNREEVLVRRKEVGLEGNVDKIKYMFTSHEQNAVHNRDIKVSYDVVEKFRHLERS